MNGKIAFYGDPHGDFTAFHASVAEARPDVAIFLGDMGLDRPFDEEIADYLKSGGKAWWVCGNHDTDSQDWYDRTFRSPMIYTNIGNRVVEIDGVRIAGLGGVFRGNVWFPRGDTISEPPKFETREEYLARLPKHHRWRGGMPLRQRSTIFPEDIDVLSEMRADVLVTHEAPSNHEFGFPVIDELAERIGAKMIVHGHHHRAYEATLPNGIAVVGVAKAGMYRMPALENAFSP
jgi:predicted phosphodiesterase